MSTILNRKDKGCRRNEEEKPWMNTILKVREKGGKRDRQKPQ